MEKKEAQQVIKKFMKDQGFQKISSSHGPYYCKYLDKDYLIGFRIDHHPFAKAYYINFGALYEPAEVNPLRYSFDFDFRFEFSAKPGVDLASFPIEDINRYFDPSLVVDYFDYEIGDKQTFEKELRINMEKKMALLYDRNFVLDLFREDWKYWAGAVQPRVEKICRLTGSNLDDVMLFRKLWPRDKNWF